MSTVAVTGASGHLGQAVVAELYDAGHIVRRVGRRFPTTMRADVVLHLAAPDWRDSRAICDFYAFNVALYRWSATTHTRVINTGSWWQHAGPEAEKLAYTRLKSDQAQLFATTLVPFSIYGDQARAGRGFVPQLQAHLRGDSSLSGVSGEPRDWIHVTDVARAYLAAMKAPAGTYDVRTGLAFSPAALARACGVDDLPDYPETPSCVLTYANETVPGWSPRIGVLSHLRAA